jgi:large subunit ribosomal protein L5
MVAMMFTHRVSLRQAGVRFFSSSQAVAGKPGCNTVKPVHHRVKIDKNRLSPRFQGLQYEKLDIRHPAYKPVATHQDRVAEYYDNSVQSDLLLINAQHGESRQPGKKRREWDGSSPFHINRSLRKPKGSAAETPDIKPHNAHNVPKIEAIHINCYVEQAKDNVNHAISALVQLQQITGVKPKPIYSKTNVLHWRVRAGYQMGAQVTLKGRSMHQFLATLTEVVFPRIREFKGVSNKSGDTLGNIQFGLKPDEVKFFPEIDQNQDNWAKTYGFHVNVVTSAQTDSEARTLLSAYGIPFHGSEKGVKTENLEY